MGPRNEQTVPLWNSPGARRRQSLASNPGAAIPRYLFNIHVGDHFTPDQVGRNWRTTEAKQALPNIVKGEAGRELVRATLSLASEGRLATVLL